MDRAISAPLFACSMFFGMLVCVEIGRRIGKMMKQPEKAKDDGFSAVDGAIFGLFGLLFGRDWQALFWLG